MKVSLRKVYSLMEMSFSKTALSIKALQKMMKESFFYLMEHNVKINLTIRDYSKGVCKKGDFS